jgi:hypothetical protein
MHISGDNLWGDNTRSYSYFFSCYCYSWGWATWRRAFRHYDPEIKVWPALRETSWLEDVVGDPEGAEFWKGKFDQLRTTVLTTGGIGKNPWDWAWLFACLAQHGLSILPSTNLISNIGFSDDATHTRDRDEDRAFVPTVEMPFPLVHPPYMIRDTEVERVNLEQLAASEGFQLGHGSSLYQRLRRLYVRFFED